MIARLTIALLFANGVAEAQASIRVQVLDAQGQPIEGLALRHQRADAEGYLTWNIGPSTRHLVLGPTGELPLGVIPLNAVVVDLAKLAKDEPVRLRTGPTASLLLVGKRDGMHAELGTVSMFWHPPFRLNFVWRYFQGGRASGLVHGLPVGLPIRVRLESQRDTPVVLRAGEVKRFELAVPAPPRMVRYRLVDPSGRVLTGGEHAWGGAYDAGRGELRIARSASAALVQLRMPDGTVWSCRPFRPPESNDRLLDGGDLVLRKDKVEYCRGRIVDRNGKPIATGIMLGDNAVFDKTVSDAEGRFVLHAPRTLPDGIPLYTSVYETQQPVLAGWGAKDLRVVVDTARPRSVHIQGRVLGLDETLVYGSAGVYVRSRVDSQRVTTTGLRPGGRITIGSKPGPVDVTVEIGDGPVKRKVWEVKGIDVPAELEFAPEFLRRPLLDGLQVARIHLVDRVGKPFAWPWYRGISAPVFQVIVPKAGEVVEFPELLQRVRVDGDRTIACDPVDVPIVVDGLPAVDGVVFGLSIRAAGGRHHTRIEPLRAGRGRGLVPRGVPLEALLHVHYIAAPFRGGLGDRKSSVQGFDGAFEIPRDGAVLPLRFAAPDDLRDQLKR